MRNLLAYKVKTNLFAYKVKKNLSVCKVQPVNRCAKSVLHFVAAEQVSQKLGSLQSLTALNKIH